MTADEFDSALFDNSLQLNLQGKWHSVVRCPRTKTERAKFDRWAGKVVCAVFPGKVYDVNELTHHTEIRDWSFSQ